LNLLEVYENKTYFFNRVNQTTTFLNQLILQLFMKRSSRRWKKKNQMRWKWQRKRLKKEKHKRKARRARSR
jgi:thiamine pyrophosphate-dependent acetolactate synthase large subunit-like protein